MSDEQKFGVVWPEGLRENFRAFSSSLAIPQAEGDLEARVGELYKHLKREGAMAALAQTPAGQIALIDGMGAAQLIMAFGEDAVDTFAKKHKILVSVDALE